MMANAFWSGPDDVSNAKPDDAKPGGQKGCVFLIRLLLPLAGWNSSSPNTASFGPSVGEYFPVGSVTQNVPN